MILCLGYFTIQIALIIVTLTSKRNFDINMKWKVSIVANNLLFFMFQVGIVLFIKSDMSKYNRDKVGLEFSKFLLCVMIISGLMVVIGLINSIIKSKSFYFLCPYGVSTFFLALNARLEQGKMQTTKEFYGKIIYIFIFYIIIALLLFIIILYQSWRKKTN